MVDAVGRDVSRVSFRYLWYRVSHSICLDLWLGGFVVVCEVDGNLLFDSSLRVSL